MKREKTIYDVIVTRTLIEKVNNNDPTVTDLEKEAVNVYNKSISDRNTRLMDANKEILENCPLLCSGYQTMIIPAYGWIDPVTDMAYQLEFLNLQYAKYHIKVNVMESKEKFGLFTFYTNIVKTEHLLTKILRYPFRVILKYLENIDYGQKTVVDVPEYKTVEWEEIDKDNFDKHLNMFDYPVKNYAVITENDKIKIEPSDMDNGKVFFKSENGKYFVSYILYHQQKSHIEYNRHQKLHRLLSPIRSIIMIIGEIENLFDAHEVMCRDFEIKVENIVEYTSELCQQRCITCGQHIGKKYYNPMCCTTGWIAYVCEKCACALGGVYSKENNDYCEKVGWFKEKQPVENPYTSHMRKNDEN